VVVEEVVVVVVEDHPLVLLACLLALGFLERSCWLSSWSFKKGRKKKKDRAKPFSFLYFFFLSSPFPMTEHPFIYDANENPRKDKRDTKGYCGKAIRNRGYQSHFTIG
jgi:hypothetical protein